MTKYKELSVEECRSLMIAKAKRIVALTEMSGDGLNRLEDRSELIEDLVKLYAAEVAILGAKPA